MALYWKSARARRAALSALKPLVEGSRARLGHIPEQAWRQPYMLGFIAMLVSLVVKHRISSDVSSEELGVAQIEAWSSLSGIADDLIGEEICLLSVNDDTAFIEGCRNAGRFLLAYHGASAAALADIDEAELLVAEAIEHTGEHTKSELAGFGRGGYVAAALWRRYFELRIAAG